MTVTDPGIGGQTQNGGGISLRDGSQEKGEAHSARRSPGATMTGTDPGFVFRLKTGCYPYVNGMTEEGEAQRLVVSVADHLSVIAGAGDKMPLEYKGCHVRVRLGLDQVISRTLGNLTKGPIFDQLLNSPNKDVREQTLRGLDHNIAAGVSSSCSDYTFDEKALPPLLGVWKTLDPT
eukprot:gene8291-1561_t